MIRFLVLSLAGLAALPAATVTTPVEYQSAGATCVGTLVTDDAWTEVRPGVLVVHDWMGLTDRTVESGKRLNALGYAAFCVDIYGKGVRPADTTQAGEQAGKYKADRPLMRTRMQDGLATFLAKAKVDAKRIGSIGYCFGGTCALELARSGADIVATVTFHGGLGTTMPAAPKAIRGRVLALHGADDPYVPAAEVAAFEDEMRAAKADWELDQYGGAVHGFTHQGAGTDPKAGYAYQALADQRSWRAMSACFADAFAAK